MIPASHIMILALLQFTVGLLGLLLRRAGMVVLVSAVVMLNGVLLFFCTPSVVGQGTQTVGVVVLVVFVILYFPLARPVSDIIGDRLCALRARAKSTRTGTGLDEVPMAYKDIDKVMRAQQDLVEPVARFDPKLVKMAPAHERPED